MKIFSILFSLAIGFSAGAQITNTNATVTIPPGITIFSTNPIACPQIMLTNSSKWPVRAAAYDQGNTNFLTVISNEVRTARIGQPIPPHGYSTGAIRPTYQQMVFPKTVAVIDAHSFTNGLIVVTSGALDTDFPTTNLTAPPINDSPPSSTP